MRLPANYEATYKHAIGELETHLGGVDGAAARNGIRALVEQVVVQPGDTRGGKRRTMQLHGDLFGMLAFAEAASGKRWPGQHNSPGA